MDANSHPETKPPGDWVLVMEVGLSYHNRDLWFSLIWQLKFNLPS